MTGSFWSRLRATKVASTSSSRAESAAWLLSLVSVVSLAACGGEGGPVDGGEPVDAHRAQRDAFMAPDVFEPVDAFVAPDAYERGVCDDYTPPTELPCFDDSTCSPMGLTCRLPVVGDICRPCTSFVHECDDSTPCGSGEECVTFEPQCACPRTICMPVCTGPSCPDASCESDGYTCPTNSTCSPTSQTADIHGCAPKTCTTDRECDCGWCSNGFCAAGPGRCVTTFDFGDGGVSDEDAAFEETDAAVEEEDAATPADAAASSDAHTENDGGESADAGVDAAST